MPRAEPNFKVVGARRPSKAERDRRQLAALKPKLLERSLGHCEGRGFSPLCTGVGAEIHHVLRRAQGGQNTLDDTVLICAHCHARIHSAPAEALVVGLLRTAHP